MATSFSVGAPGVNLAGAATFGGSGASQAVLQRARFEQGQKLAKELADLIKDADEGTKVAIGGLIEKLESATLPPTPPPPSGSQRRLDTAVAETAATLPDLNVRNAFTEGQFQFKPDAVNRSPFNTLVDQNTLRGLDPRTNANLRNTPEDIATELIAAGKGSAGRFDSQINLPESLTKLTQQSLGVQSLAGVAPSVPAAAPPPPVPAPAVSTQRAKAVQVAQAFRQQPGRFSPAVQGKLIEIGVHLKDFQGILDVVDPGGVGFKGASPEGKFLQDLRNLQAIGDLEGAASLIAERNLRLASKSDSRSKLGKLQDRRALAEAELAVEQAKENPDLKKIERLERNITEQTDAIVKEGGSADSGAGLTETGKNLKLIGELRDVSKTATPEQKILIDKDIATLQKEILTKQAARDPSILRQVDAVIAAMDVDAVAKKKFGEKSPQQIRTGNRLRLTLEAFNRGQNEIFISISPDGEIIYQSGPGAADKALVRQKQKQAFKTSQNIEIFLNAGREFASAMDQARDSRDWFGAFGAGGFTKNMINGISAPFGPIPFDDVTNFNITVDNIRTSLNAAIRSNPNKRNLRLEFTRMLNSLPDAGAFRTNKKLAIKMLGKSLATILGRMTTVTGAKQIDKNERIQMGRSLGLDIRSIAAMVVDPDPSASLNEEVAMDLIETFYPDQANTYVDLLELALTGK